MPVKVEITPPPPPANSKQLGVSTTLLYNGSKFEGFQKCKGNSYAVEVVLQVWVNLVLGIFYFFNKLSFQIKLRFLLKKKLG